MKKILLISRYNNSSNTLNNLLILWLKMVNNMKYVRLLLKLIT